MKIYFASDFHLGVPDHESSLVRERLLVQWLEHIRKDATEIFLMGDIFDFWFEYKTVIPKGFARLFGKLAEITDQGIPIFLFRGNHDIWAFDYFSQELGVQLKREPLIREWNGKRFFLAHGDGLGPGDLGYKFLKRVFEFRPNQWLFNWLHPDLGTRLALYLSRKSRYANVARDKKEIIEKGSIELKDERLYAFARNYLTKDPNIDYFIMGHRHIPIVLNLNEQSVFVNLGDWITNFSYAVFNGESLELLTFKNGKPEQIIQPSQTE